MATFWNPWAMRAPKLSSSAFKLAFFLVIGSFLGGCKERPKPQQQDNQAIEETAGTAAQAHPGGNTEASWMDEITLDQGAKWAANAETTSGVAQMIALIGNTRAESPGDYQKLGDGLNEIKNYIVRECTMTGPSHDNLHVWLYPLIEKVGQLQKVETVESGKAMTDAINGHLEEYYEYFI